MAETKRKFPWIAIVGGIVAVPLSIIAPIGIVVFSYWWETTATHETASYGNITFSGLDGRINTVQSKSFEKVEGIWVDVPDLGKLLLDHVPIEHLSKFEQHDHGERGKRLFTEGLELEVPPSGEVKSYYITPPAAVAKSSDGEYVKLPCTMADLRRVFGEPDSYKREWNTRPGMIGH